MAEAQSPVIVEEDNENIVPPADNRTVGERIEAGEVALANEGEVTTDASGRPQNRNKTALQPKPEANVPTQIQVQAAVPPVTFKSLQPEVEQDIERAKEPVLSYESVLEKLDNDETVVIPGPTKSHTYSGPNIARLACTPDFAKKIKLQVAIANDLAKRTETVPESPDIAFLTPTGKVDVSYLDPDLQDTAQVYAEGCKALDDTLRPLINTGRKDIDVAVDSIL